MAESLSDQSIQPVIVSAMASVLEPVAQTSHDDQLSKEAEVGITEFVSPDVPGFVGILKKRCVPMIPFCRGTSAEKSYR